MESFYFISPDFSMNSVYSILCAIKKFHFSGLSHFMGNITFKGIPKLSGFAYVSNIFKRIIRLQVTSLFL